MERKYALVLAARRKATFLSNPLLNTCWDNETGHNKCETYLLEILKSHTHKLNTRALSVSHQNEERYRADLLDEDHSEGIQVVLFNGKKSYLRLLSYQELET